MQTLAKTVFISPQSSCKWSIFTESSTVSLHRTRPIRMKRLSLEIPFSSINLTALAWASFYINLHITYFMLAKHNRHPFNSQNSCNCKIQKALCEHTKPYTKHLSMTMIIKSTTASHRHSQLSVTGLSYNKEKQLSQLHVTKIVYSLNQANLLWPFSF